MTSQIDPTVPIFGTPTTASVRENFLIAKNEITALQGLIPGGGSGGFGPPINIGAGGTITLPSSASYFIFVANTTGGPITVGLPNGLITGQQLVVKDAIGNAGTHTITVNALASIDNNLNYSLISDFASLSVVWTGSMWGTF